MARDLRVGADGRAEKAKQNADERSEKEPNSGYLLFLKEDLMNCADYTLQNFCLASLSTTSVEVRALSAEEETVRVVSSISSHPTDWSDLAWMERMERLAGTRSSKD
ncbi:uncharacterized protein LOC121588924 isoform X2 [Anopheles merus]|uniref:uncharacterized protein LOC121588924 isoform X2 n=1 Tax=Anopheles merus TaxID=30066 RepID=UPI001BE3D84C|nr:uncharacterized protein LOC121588924 isoform X2 [Anopheles merus]